MGLLIQVFGEGKDLSTLQMVCRGVVIFLIALALIRISGRRSFGVKSPFDNIIAILLGAILSRAVVGASAFLPTVITCTVIVAFHRLLAWLTIRHEWVRRIIEGRKILLFKDNKFIRENMDKGLVCEDDIRQGVRKSALTDNMEDIEAVYIERNGEISAVKKKKENN
jgi:uncharacterized membrane protein YcaP (DUF421 family)